MRFFSPIMIAYPATLCIVGVLAIACDSTPSAAAALEANIRASTQVTAKVTYEFLTVDPTVDPPDASLVTTTVVNRPPNRRVDVVQEGVSQSFLSLNDQLIKCVDSECRYVDSSESLVLNRLGFADLSLGFGDNLLEEIRSGGKVEELPGDNVAGVPAECFRVTLTHSSTPDVGDLITETCFASKDAILLSMGLRNTDYPEVTASATATSVSYDVTDEEFAMPFPLVEG